MTERAPIRVAQTPGGPLLYLIDAGPESLPPVRSGELADAWDAAREAATTGQWGTPRLLRFIRGPGGPLDLALSDQDACCWAASIDARIGLHTPAGLSICLRLLALIDLLAHDPSLYPLCRIGRDGATLDPVLLRLAATAPLTAHARFDHDDIRAKLANRLANRLPPGAPSLLTGASS